MRAKNDLRVIRVISRLEELLAAKYDRELYVAEISRAVGVPARTLRSYCKKHLGMSPMRYLCLRRLRLARSALLAADPRTTTVARIATENGLFELGRFSVEYQKVFGEPPSATLRRRLA
jgi:AraC-like DNA-binding protein